jgi:murein L,D-transpeptidase YafK
MRGCDLRLATADGPHAYNRLMLQVRNLCKTGQLSAWLLAAWLLLPAAAGADPALLKSNYTPTNTQFQLPSATRVVVRKSERRMELMRGQEVLRSYHVSLGLQPTGHKERVGDFRTPEGRYYLVRRNPRSDFFLSIQVSYPAPDDIKRAKRNGLDPGGSIMIHGLPNRLKREPGYYLGHDWTDGCIAVSNADMVEIWMLTNNDTPIDILP